jgi:23S rRNA (pseudouridine1915-N3)-methyltransferase
VRITLIAVGQKMPAWVTQAFDEYVRRLPPHVRFTLKEVRAEPRSANAQGSSAMAAEAERIRAAMPQGGALIALDERGERITSTGLADQWRHWEREGVHPVLVIGGADGLSADLKQMAARQWSLSGLTLPHGMVRVVVAEQLYRAWAISEGHPYHRE